MPPNLQTYQETIGAYLRSPKSHPRPYDLPERRLAVYESLVFNATKTQVDACFPVARTLLSDSVWNSLVKTFFALHACDTPYFHEISQAFVEFITYASTNTEATSPNISLISECPPWLPELLRYEWWELAADLAPSEKKDSISVTSIECEDAESGSEIIYLTPAMFYGQFEWPVHKLSPSYLPIVPEATFLAVFRDNEHRVQFVELSPASFLLISIVGEGVNTRGDISALMSSLLLNNNSDELVAVAIDTLIRQGVLIKQEAQYA